MDCIYDKILFLVRYLNECTKAYDEGNPKITDEEWDKKYFELKSLEKEDIKILLKRAVYDTERGMGSYDADIYII